ncbi:putative nuclease HARBI1 [Periplaneta americana]|uniref:putative nuclease HARBI1 n=1 Tax=Periplaneta americana TaxID=6978 RepID=UPI0037E9C820
MAAAFDAELLYLEYLEDGELVIENYRPRNSDFEELDEIKFHERYRLKKHVVELLLEQIEDRLEYNTDRNNPLTPIQQLLLALRFYATGSYQLVIGDVNGVSKSTVSRYVRKISYLLASLRPQYIKFPTGDEIPSVIQDFYNIAQFPGVIGTIDCTHIPILSPGGNMAEIYRNRKSYFSLNVQTISDSQLFIRDIVARWPGSVHDSTIFQRCGRRMLFETGRIGRGLLLGDSGYPLKPYLMTPLLNPRTQAEQNYNNSHIATRNTVERQYGIWKRRFPALNFGLRTNINTAMDVIVATAVLHNIALQTNHEDPPDDVTLEQFMFNRERWQFEDVPVPEIVNGGEGGAIAVRTAIINNHFA